MTYTSDRYVPVEDLSVRSEGGARYIDAYCSAFGIQQEIRDREGHYIESIDPPAFDKTLAQRGLNVQVLFNHGRTIHGESSERYSMPYGVPVAITPDTRGLFTSTRVADTPLGDEVYTLARDGALPGMSFSGEFRTTRTAGKVGSLTHKVRTEIALREYGSTPFPAYGAAQLVQVRAQLFTCSEDELRALLADASPDEIAALRAVLDVAALADPGTGSTNDGHTATGSVVNPNAIAARLMVERLGSIAGRVLPKETT